MPLQDRRQFDEGVAAEAERVEARRREIAEMVEAARVDAATRDRDERKRLASGLEEAHGRELAETKWRIDGHDDHFKVLNGSVEKLAGAVEQQATATVDLRQEIRDSFATQESAALRRELAAAKQARDAEEEAKRLAKESEEKAAGVMEANKGESRKLYLQFAGVVAGGLITAVGAIVLKLA